MKLSSALGILALIAVLLIALWLVFFIIRLAILLLPLIIVVLVGIWVYNKFLKTKA